MSVNVNVKEEKDFSTKWVLLPHYCKNRKTSDIRKTTVIILNLDGWFRVLHPFQQYFSHIGMMEWWTWKTLCNEMLFRFGKNLTGIRTRSLVFRSQGPLTTRPHGTVWFHHMVMCSKDSDWIANSIGPDQTVYVGLHNLPKPFCPNMSHIMRKPVYATCEQQRRRSACASAQSD